MKHPLDYSAVHSHHLKNSTHLFVVPSPAVDGLVLLAANKTQYLLKI